MPRTAWPGGDELARERLPAARRSRRSGLVPHAAALAVLAHARLDLLLADLRRAAAALELVLRLDHLLDVVELVLGLDLGRPRRLPVEESRAERLENNPSSSTSRTKNARVPPNTTENASPIDVIMPRTMAASGTVFISHRRPEQPDADRLAASLQPAWRILTHPVVGPRPTPGRAPAGA